MKARLVTWEWAGDAAAVADAVAAVLNPRWGDARVMDVVETLYALANSTPGELAVYARARRHNPYPAKRTFDRIVCGHHPWLEARIVSDFKVRVDQTTGLEVISWKEPDVYAVSNDGPVKTRDGVRKEFRRRINGPLSSEAIWDRSRNAFKAGWGPSESPPRPWG